MFNPTLKSTGARGHTPILLVTSKVTTEQTPDCRYGVAGTNEIDKAHCFFADAGAVPPRLNTTNQAFGPTLGNDPTSDDTSGVSSAPIDALLYEAR
jgi:hypothetical protein